MILRRGNTTLDTETRQLVAATECRITPSEALLLAALLTSPKAIPYGRLLDLLWGDHEDGPEKKIVQVYGCHLRRALKRIGSDVVIKTIWKYGYMIEGAAAERLVTLPVSAAHALRGLAHAAGRADLVAVLEAV